MAGDSQRRIALKLERIAIVLFVVYIVAFSFVPLVYDTLLGNNKWVGYGNGAYVFQSRKYFVFFNDPYDGSSKPQIYVDPDFAPATRISLLEFSDWASWINGHNLFSEFNATVRSIAPTLMVTYVGFGTVIQKLVNVSPSGVNITLRSDKEFKAHIELWRWVMTSINRISVKDVSNATSIAATRSIAFGFDVPSPQGLGRGSILLSATPTEIKIWPYTEGFNKITIDFMSSEMIFAVSGSVEPVGVPKIAWSSSYLSYVLPVVAISVVVLYLLVDEHGRTSKNNPSGCSS